MDYRSSPKTSDSSSRECYRNRKKGSILIATVFLFLAFSTLALGLIFISQVYLRIGGYEKNSSRLDYGAENALKEAFHRLASAVGSAPSPAVLSEESFLEFRDDVWAAGNRLIEATVLIRFPVQIRSQEGSLFWQSRTECKLDRAVERDGYFLAVYGLPVQAEGKLRGLSFQRSSSLAMEAQVLAGRIPLSAFPFMVDSSLSPEERGDYLEKNGITLVPSSREVLPPRVSFAAEPLIPEGASPLLGKALDIEIFRPQDITAARLRTVLGLEESQDPVPEGVYLIRNDLGLGGVYVEGDIQEMVTAIEGNYQIISFRMEEGVWVLKYSPAESRTSFSSPWGEETFDLVPLGLIVISGEVQSLGGGIVQSGGVVRLVTDREVPSILPGAKLTLVASGMITITSHLVQQGLSWQEGIPYIKDEQSQLVIFSTGRDLWTEAAIEGGLVVAADAPQNLTVQAALTAGDEGLKINGQEKTVRVLGSIQTTAYSASGSQLRLTPWTPRPSVEEQVNGPRTALPVLFITRFGASRWKEY